MRVEKPKLDEEKLREALGTVAGLHFPPQGSPMGYQEYPSALSKEIMVDLGKYLTKLHSIELVGFGYIDENKLNNVGELVGRYGSWFDFWRGFFESQVEDLDRVLEEERQSGQQTSLTQPQRVEFEYLLGGRSYVRDVIQNKKSLFLSAPGRLLNGNIHLESISISDGKFTGLEDFRQMLVGDPVDDLAYFSVMPRGQELVKYTKEGWSIDVPNFDERFHLYRLLEAYRKIYTRYVKHHWLGDFPEPLLIAKEELSYFGFKDL